MATDKTCWYADGLRFTCRQSGYCCTGPPGYVWLSDTEITAIAEHLQIAEKQFLRHYAHAISARWSLNECLTSDGGGYDCVFLETDHHGKPACKIYPVRPMQCRTWPFWPENLAGRGAWRRAAKTCPGIAAGLAGDGRLYPPHEIRQSCDRTPHSE